MEILKYKRTTKKVLFLGTPYELVYYNYSKKMRKQLIKQIQEKERSIG